MAKVQIDKFRTNRGLRESGDEHLWESFKLLRGEAIKRGIVLDDEGYLFTAKSNQKPLIAMRLEALIGQVQIIEERGKDQKADGGQGAAGGTTIKDVHNFMSTGFQG